MNKEALDFMTEKTKELMNASSCCEEVKSAAQAWLDAAGTENEAEQTKKYLGVLEANVMDIDKLISFAESEEAIEMVGAEKAKGFADHGRQIKAAGAKYCDCPACSVGAAILEKKDELLK